VITRQQDSIASHVVECEGEHAVQLTDEGVSPRLVGMDQDFGVAVRPERVSHPGQSGREFTVIVDFSVE